MRFSFTLAVAALVSGCTPQVEIGSLQAPIVGGTTDTGDPGVVLVVIGNINGGAIGMCTGELVSPHVVLTAGHCVNESGPFNIYKGYDMNRLRPNELLPGTPHLHPNYPFPKGSLQVAENYDIGVVVLKDPITDITPLPMNLGTDPSTLAGSDIRLVGYGSTGSISPSDTSAGTKRQTSSVLSRVSQRLLEFDDSRHATCEGDSGGPALATINGVETIIGVTSYGEQNVSTDRCDGRGFDTRVDLYTADFIQPFIDENDPPPPVNPGDPPKPGTLGASCSAPEDCNSKICAPGGYCSALCDPNASTCGSTFQCTAINNDPSQGYICQGTPRASSGCDVGNSTPNGIALLLMLLLLVVKVRPLHG